jgi:aerobic-type carbon monoxide dehydrogenase small subunit (CoxS/CutS family)
MKLFVNGKEIEVPAAAMEKRIVEFLREDLDLTGAKNACDVGACGACTILVNDEPIRICIKRVKDFAGQHILTIEGLAAPDGTLHPLQQAFVDCGAIQCGYCTPGMVMTAHAFLLQNPHPTREQIRRAIFQNLCRCTGYQQIIDAIEQAAPHYRSVASGVSPDVEDGILPSGMASDISKSSEPATASPPGRMPGSTAGRRPTAT